MGKSLDVLGCSDPCGARCGRASVLFCAEKGGRGEVPARAWARLSGKQGQRHAAVYACTHTTHHGVRLHTRTHEQSYHRYNK